MLKVSKRREYAVSNEASEVQEVEAIVEWVMCDKRLASLSYWKLIWIGLNKRIEGRGGEGGRRGEKGEKGEKRERRREDTSRTEFEQFV